MSKTVFGMLAGGGLGLIDGLSAWMYPEAPPVLGTIVIGSTMKGVLTGAAAGLVAQRRHSMLLGILAGLGVGFALSTLAAQGQPGHYWEIVLPGMLVGVIAGFLTQRYPAATAAGDRSRMPFVLLLGAAAAASSMATVTSAQAQGSDTLTALDAFIGRWEGTSEGRPGKGTVEREYSRVLGTRFVHVHNRNVYPPQEKSPKGETHEDLGIFSFDAARKRIVFRQFHVEGFVNQYVQDPSAKPGTLVLTTEAIENIPAGWRARETYTVSSTDVEEVFELAEPGKDFEVYSRTRLKKIR